MNNKKIMKNDLKYIKDDSVWCLPKYYKIKKNKFDWFKIIGFEVNKKNKIIKFKVSMPRKIIYKLLNGAYGSDSK